eukprot:TRINITY_DN2864_c0_g2_i5.p1 TRINITY_DN2864_c0_g2~~TRINITY_DN2864_c0_g2_i5.p1  ORF type:complete len:236 (+),score=30.14 TRINITY_DN2864_c0_g2_i5:589-1296(+)
MKEKWLSYYKHMYDLSEILMSLFALSLDLESDYFVNSLKGGNSSLRSVYYPNVRMDHDETVEHKEFVRSGEHTDWGCLTILKPDANIGGTKTLTPFLHPFLHQNIKRKNKISSSFPNHLPLVYKGLQIKTIDNTWMEIPFVPNGFVVNLGDLFPRWTNDQWKATPHKVILPPDFFFKENNSRMTMPYFALVNPNTLIRCVPSCRCKGAGHDDDEKYLPILAGEFFKFHEKYSVYQ